MHVFCWGRFSGRLPIGIAHLNPKTRGNACQFFVGCWPTAVSDFKPLKEGEMLVNFSLGVFLVACRSEWAV